MATQTGYTDVTINWTSPATTGTQTAYDDVQVTWTSTAATGGTLTASDDVTVTWVGSNINAYRWNGAQFAAVGVGYWDGAAVQMMTSAGQQQPTPTGVRLVRSGIQLLEGAGGPAYRTTGWNSYVMRSAGGTQTQTMSDSQRDAFFASLTPGSLVRVWAFPPAANTYTDDTVLAEQDKVVASAKAYGHRLIFTLADWYGNANDGTGTKDATWLTGQAYLGRYASWLDTIVARYADEPAVAIWDLLNEPRVPNNSADLKTFVDSMGARVKAAAPGALVMCGVLTPTLSCGSAAGYQTVMGSAQIDLVSMHDYFEVPGVDDQFATARATARALTKPMVVDEVGVWASASYATTGNSPGGFSPVDYADQALIIREKLRLYAGAPEIAAALVWSEMENGINDPAYEPPPGAPARTTVHDFPLRTGGTITPTTVAGLEGWVKSVDVWRVPDGSTTGRMYRRGTSSNYTTAATAVHDDGAGRPTWRTTNTATWLDWPAIDPAQTWFFVVKPTTLTAGQRHYLAGVDNGSGGLAVYIDGTTGRVNIYNEGAAAPFGQGTVALLTGGTYLIEVHFTKSTGAWQIWVNGVKDATGTATVGAFAATSNTSLLRQFTWQQGGAFVGDFYEALKFNVDLGATDAATVRGYLTAEYTLGGGTSGGGGTTTPGGWPTTWPTTWPSDQPTTTTVGWPTTWPTTWPTS